jgi:hypothetical protein
LFEVGWCGDVQANHGEQVWTRHGTESWCVRVRVGVLGSRDEGRARVQEQAESSASMSTRIDADQGRVDGTSPPAG